MSNMGSIGGTILGPVITSPQVAIVALGRIQTLPRFGADGKEVVASKVLNASWAGDHRGVDGASMARFVNDWKALLESPALMLGHLK
jgi:2-oxoisovalerate dehydrogenase E2 component (dihydrolipoyl transacylase)